MAVCVGISFWQERELGDKDAQKARLQQHLEGYNLRVDKNLILKLVEDIRVKNRANRAIGKKYLNLAVIGELVKLTPSNVRLLSISTRLGPLPDKKPPKNVKKKKKQAESSPKVVIIEGIVKGSRLSLESALAGYLMELKKSPLFEQPTVNKKSFEFSGNDEVLLFTAKLNLV